MPRVRRWRNRSNRARRRMFSSPPIPTGWITRSQRSINEPTPRQPARQHDRADRAEGFENRQRHDRHRASISPNSPATARIATGDVKSVPVGKYAKAALEKLGAWPAAAAEIRDGGKRARRACAGGARRSRARHRLCDRRQGRTRREDRRHLPGRFASADHLSGRGDGDRKSRKRRLPRVPAIVGSAGRYSRNTASPCSARPAT